MEMAFEGESDRVRGLILKQWVAQYAHHEKMLDINPSKYRIGQAVMTEEERGGQWHITGWEVAGNKLFPELTKVVVWTCAAP